MIYRRRLERKYRNLSNEALLEEIEGFFGIFSDDALDIATAEARGRGGMVAEHLAAFQRRQAQEKVRLEHAVQRLEGADAGCTAGRPKRVTVLSWALILWGAVVCLLALVYIMPSSYRLQNEDNVFLLLELVGGFQIVSGYAMLGGHAWARLLWLRAAPVIIWMESYGPLDIFFISLPLYLACSLILSGPRASAFFEQAATQGAADEAAAKR